VVNTLLSLRILPHRRRAVDPEGPQPYPSCAYAWPLQPAASAVPSVWCRWD